MMIARVDEAKSELAKLVAEVESGAEVVITRGDQPVARLRRYAEPSDRGFSSLTGRTQASATWADVEAGDIELGALFDIE